MKKNGFIATSVMFSFFLVFITLSVLILLSYAHYRTLINQLNAIETFEGINNISIENENNVLPDLLMITKNKDSYNN